MCMCLEEDGLKAPAEETTELPPNERDSSKGNDAGGKSDGSRRSDRIRRDIWLMEDYEDYYPRSACTKPAKWCYDEGCSATKCTCQIWWPDIPDVCRERNSG